MLRGAKLGLGLSCLLAGLTACDGGGGSVDGGDAAAAPDGALGGVCRTDEGCDDGVFCNGVETCDPEAPLASRRGCLPGRPPCEDGARCVEETDVCDTECAVPDADGDGHSAIDCGGDDCDDEDAARFPGAVEICDPSGVDEDCDRSTLGGPNDGDRDRDGFVGASCCNRQDDGTLLCGDDCDDMRSGVNPGTPESCNGVDDDCSGDIDDGDVTATFYRDVDGDGRGDDSTTTAACSAPEGHAALGGDCDDGDAARLPGGPEVCDGRDNDCDDDVDEDIGGTYYPDADEDGYGVSSGTVTACSRPEGYSDRAGDCDDAAPMRHPGLPEVCDGLDNDCNGEVDDGAASASWYVDGDGDGFGVTGDVVRSCEPVAGRSLMPGDCDDDNAARNPSAPEVCDGADNDCDGIADDGVAMTWYRDADGDGFGLATESQAACTRPDGFAPFPGDCDDTTASRNPALPELCDEVDNDCDLEVDEGVVVPRWYGDGDGDGYGDPAAAVRACGAPEDHVALGTDCDDTIASRNPGAPEVCDGVDNDCDGVADDGVAVRYYRDADGDGFGTSDVAGEGNAILACSRPDGYVDNSADCDDGQAARNPAAPEVCDGLDNDCNGLLDAIGEDGDGDGVTVPACGGGDCDNTRADVYPGAPELCDGRDNDCDGLLDGPGEDADGDGRAAAVCGGVDCDDTEPTVYPGAVERCDGLDNDCDGLLDGPGEDVDGDGFASIGCGGGDCDDGLASVHPEAPEICDAHDNDCDGALMSGEDDDLDGWADQSCGGGDCDDTLASVHPTAAELCDGLDNDCDDALGASEDADRDGYASLSCGPSCVGSCGDCDDARTDVYPDAPELCDGRDNDCDGALGPVGEDDDGDGHADAVTCAETCTAVCDDCDDEAADVYPGIGPVSVCDGVDNDCDGRADELDMLTSADLAQDGATSDNGRGDGAMRTAQWDGQAFGVVVSQTTGAGYALRLYRLNHELQTVAGPHTLATDASNNRWPSLVWTGSEYLYVFESDRDADSRVFVGGAARDGTPTLPHTLIAAPDPASVLERPRMAWDGTRALVYWTQSDGTAHARTVTPAGVLGAVHPLAGGRTARVTPRPGGGWLALRRDPANQRVHTTVLAADGSEAAESTYVQMIRTPDGNLVVHTIGDRVVFAVGTHGSGFTVYALDADGAVVGGPSFHAVGQNNQSGQAMAQLSATTYADRMLLSVTIDGPRLWEFDSTATMRTDGVSAGYFFIDLRAPMMLASDGLSHFVGVNQYGGWVRQSLWTCH